MNFTIFLWNWKNFTIFFHTDTILSTYYCVYMLLSWILWQKNQNLIKKIYIKILSSTVFASSSPLSFAIFPNIFRRLIVELIDFLYAPTVVRQPIQFLLIIFIPSMKIHFDVWNRPRHYLEECIIDKII